MDSPRIVPVILSGGSGTRLWPVSRASLPKQLLPMVDDRTMLEATIDRLEGITHVAPPLVVCNVVHQFAVAHQVAAAGYEPHLILEPFGRNTAPAVAAAALALAAEDDPIMLVLPADHVIGDEPAFHRTVAVAASAAVAGKLATFGIVPTHPETGYGYIRRGETVAEGTFAVDRFVEKPDLETARTYLASGDYLWNSGMFLFRAGAYLEELAALAPEMLEHTTQAWDSGTLTAGATLLDADAFAACPADSIDYAVMERTAHGVVIPLDAGWNDVGSWSAVHDVAPSDANGNVIRGDVVLHDVTNSYVRAQSRLVTAAGLDGYGVIETADAVMVAPLARSQDVKGIVDLLKEANRTEAKTHPFADRLWGRHVRVSAGHGYAVEQLEIDPGLHAVPDSKSEREEVWTVVRGKGVASVGATTHDLGIGGSVKVPVGSDRSIRNTGEGPLVVVVVTTTPYLEDRPH